MRRKDLDVGEVISQMQFGEYAIPVIIGTWSVGERMVYTPTKRPVHFRDSDGILVALGDSQPLIVGKARNDQSRSAYMIVSKEEYETYRDTGVLPE